MKRAVIALLLLFASVVLAYESDSEASSSDDDVEVDDDDESTLLQDEETDGGCPFCTTMCKKRNRARKCGELAAQRGETLNRQVTLTNVAACDADHRAHLERLSNGDAKLIPILGAVREYCRDIDKLQVVWEKKRVACVGSFMECLSQCNADPEC